MCDPTTVDGTTTDELTGRIVLLIEEDRAWRETELMHRQLAAKVKTYVRHSRSPEFTAEHGKVSKTTIVRLVNQHQPGEDSLDFFGRVAYELSKHGLAFEHQLGEDGIPEDLEFGTAAAPPSPDQTGLGPITPLPTQPPPTDEPSPDFEPALDGPAAEPRAAAQPPSKPELFAPEPVEPEPEAEQFEPEYIFEPRHRSEPVSFEEPSELEQLIDEALREEGTGSIDAEPLTAAVEHAPVLPPPSEDPTFPPFFPEEEFGRAIPDMDEVEAILEIKPEPAIIETARGERIRLDLPDEADLGSAARAGSEAGPSLPRALAAAGSAALAGALGWALLSIPAANGASPLSLAIALMVGISVRLRGGGQTTPFRTIGVAGTLVGALVGAVLAAAALTATGVGFAEIAPDHPAGLSGMLSIVTNPGAAVTALDRYYGFIDLAVVAVAAAIAYRLSAAKPPDEVDR